MTACGKCSTESSGIMESVLRSKHEQSGAVLGEVGGASVPRHFGDSAAEYRAVRENVGIADRSDLAVIRLHGRDPVKMMQGLITNDLAGASAGKGVYAGMLTPKGRMIAELRAFTRETPAGNEVIVLLPREALAGTRDHLKKFVPPMFAKWEDASDDLTTIGIYGPRSGELLEAMAGVTGLDDQEGFATAEVAGAPLLIARTDYAGGEEGYDLIVPSASAIALWESLLEKSREMGGAPIGFGALETLRVEAGIPRYGSELTEETIPTEAYEAIGMTPRAISFTKGCYTGQEVIIRIAHRGHVNRHLRGLKLGELPAPAVRTPLFNGETGKEIGWTTSAVHSPRLAETVALAFVRREIEPGQSVRLGSVDGDLVRVVDLPFEASDS